MLKVILPSVNQVLRLLKNSISKELFAHSNRVEETARRYASKLGIDRDKASLAGLLHDCAKELPASELLKIARENNIHVFEEDKEEPNELHARVGVVIAKEKYNIFDPEILEGIGCHTFGEPKMCKVAEVTLVADDTEPERKEKYSKPIRTALEEHGLSYATLVTLNIKAIRASAKSRLIHPLLNKARNSYILELKDLITKESPRLEL